MVEELNELASFIVPVYNVGEYIGKCVSSIQKQTYKNIEIILVDDGSKDKSSIIIDNFAEKDDRIRVIHKKNDGVSSARNLGLKYAQGEYILFIDGDDYIEPEYASNLIDLVKNNCCEMAVIMNYFTNDNNIAQSNMRKYYVERPTKIAEDIYLGKLYMAVWNKLYCRSFLEKYNIHFNPDIWYGEGMLFNMECLRRVEKVAVGERPLYHYVNNPNSVMRKRFNLENEHCGLKSLLLQKKSWGSRFHEVEKAWEYHYHFCLFAIVKGIIKTDTIRENRDEYNKCIAGLRNNTVHLLTLKVPLKRKISFIMTTLAPRIWSRILIGRELYKENHKSRLES